MRNLFDLDPDVKVMLPDGSVRSLAEYMWPTSVLTLASFVLALSLFTPYWKMTLHAPQYPQGLRVAVYVDRLEGDVREIDGLNHYLGMPSLNEGAQVERRISVAGISVMALLVLAAVFVHNRWAWVISIPALAYPLIFLADLHYILDKYGHSIDPHAALGSSVKPFTPPLFGVGHIGQFSTEASAGPGLYLALTAMLLVGAGLLLHRQAYKTLRRARRRAALAAQGQSALGEVAQGA